MNILFFVDNFSRHASKQAKTYREFTAASAPNIRVEYISLKKGILSDSGWRFAAKLSLTVSSLLGTPKVEVGTFHPNGNVGVDGVNYKDASDAVHGDQ